jgi:hypothetical protein
MLHDCVYCPDSVGGETATYSFWCAALCGIAYCFCSVFRHLQPASSILSGSFRESPAIQKYCAMRCQSYSSCAAAAAAAAAADGLCADLHTDDLSLATTLPLLHQLMPSSFSCFTHSLMRGSLFSSSLSCMFNHRRYSTRWCLRGCAAACMAAPHCAAHAFRTSSRSRPQKWVPPLIRACKQQQDRCTCACT